MRIVKAEMYFKPVLVTEISESVMLSKDINLSHLSSQSYLQDLRNNAQILFLK